MLDRKVTHTAHPHLSTLDCILHGPPALQPRLLSSIRTMQQEEINIAQAALLDRLLN